MRRYWLPAGLADQIPVSDGPPRRVRLLGQDLVVFRDTRGRIGVLDEACAHRGASLALGRVEDCGIRCIYHGWKYEYDGTIVDAPNAIDSRVTDKLRAQAYPAREAGGLLWVYLGPPDRQPVFPGYRFLDLPASHRVEWRVTMDCNWMQVLEGAIDSSHFGILHSDMEPFTNRQAAQLSKLFRDSGLEGGGESLTEFVDNCPKIEVVDTDFGYYYAALRRPSSGDPSLRFARVTAFVMPCLAFIPPGVAAWRIPIDDTHTAFTAVHFDVDQPVDRARILATHQYDQPGLMEGDHLEMRAENRWFQDRDRMAESFSGIRGVQLEDAAVVLSMGPVYDRTREHLVPADIAVIRARRILLAAARAVAVGQDPIGVRCADPAAIACHEAILREGDRWQTRLEGTFALAT
jgi:phenylpropionate dioxygenase-like ring-hydroxylating dioxygenase large terminal subunit